MDEIEENLCKQHNIKISSWNFSGGSQLACKSIPSQKNETRHYHIETKTDFWKLRRIDALLKIEKLKTLTKETFPETGIYHKIWATNV